MMMESLKSQIQIITKSIYNQKQNYSELLRINDKITTMLGTKDPLAFQAVQAVNLSANDAYSVEYVDPSDEAEARRVHDLTGSGLNSAGQDDELPDEYVQSQWNSWDDPEFVARSIAEGSG